MSVIEVPITRPLEKGALNPEIALLLLRRYFEPGMLLLDPFGWPPIFHQAGRDFGFNIISVDLRRGVDVCHLPFRDGVFDGCVSHPPYWDARKYSDSPGALENAKKYELYISKMRKAIEEITRVVERGRLLIVVGDRRKRGILYPIHADIIILCREVGWDLYDLLIVRSSLFSVKVPLFTKPGSKPPCISHCYALIFDHG